MSYDHPDRRLDPPEYPDMCACGHCYDDHDETGACCVCDCAKFEEATDDGPEYEPDDREVEDE